MKTLATVLLVLVAIAAPSPSRAATGVSEERVSLPDGPGSLEGIGENVELNLNMGAMSYSVPIEVPRGFPGLTPAVSLAYSSSNGASVVGMGWMLAMPSIERLTVRGLPRYALDDEIAVDGGEELVYTGGTEPRTYRARFEKGFVRYRWHDAGDGSAGWWTAEQPDGLVSTYGATSDGTPVADAQVGGAQGTFRWRLVETVDRQGHALSYTWKRYGSVTLIDRIGWVFPDGATPRYEVVFTYEARSDKISDCKAGFEELLDQRLERVDVFAYGTRLRHYDLSYEDYATSGGFSRLTGVQMFGLADGAYPVHHGFEYSRALGVDCRAGQGCDQPYVVAMGALGVDIGQGKATLVDINGDSLPDVVDTTEVGQPHRFFLNALGADGTHGFALPFESALGTQASHALGTPYVQVLDVNGDGFTDLVNQQTGDVLLNRGEGDWSEVLALGAGGGLPDLGAEGTLTSTKFFDYNGDKRIDLVLSRFSGAANETLAWQNTAAGFVSDPGAQPVGEGFEAPALELNDLNGDGLLDVAQVLKDSVRYRLSLGWGRWSDWRVVTGFDFTDQEAVEAELEDLNGDALADLVLVAGNELRYWINRNGTSFDPERVLTSADVGGDLPEKKLGTTVLYADMNGNGSADVVWVQGAESGSVTYLELFPARPNLITRITNGLGRVTEVTYASSVAERARDAEAATWTHALPFPMTVVSRTDEWDELSLVHTVTDYAYHDGYYDGLEKRFRGYTSVEGSLAGDDLQEAGVTYETYDVGASDPYRAGLQLAEEQTSGGRSIQMSSSSYDDCDVAGVPAEGLRWPVRTLCRTGQVVLHREGAPQADWARVETAWRYDGYGNVTLESKLGVTSLGGAACAPCEGDGYTGTPCGPTCLGDEAYTATTYAVPTDNQDRWLLGKPVRVRTFGVATAAGEPASGTYTETLTYYDGDAFTGLPFGQVTHGLATRVTARVDEAGTTLTRTRNRFDDHGNVIETLDPLGAPGSDTHRRLYTMSDDALRVVRVDVLNADDGGPYALRQEVGYDPLWDKPVEGTAWMVAEGGVVQSARNSTFFVYDEFGRLSALIRPGDELDSPTEEYSYELGSPVSRIVTRKRTETGAEPSVEIVRCIDGRGRDVQVRTRLAGDQYRVKGFKVFNAHGSVREDFYPYLSSGSACDAEPPADLPSRKTAYDAAGRIVEVRADPVEGETGPLVIRTTYRPLATAEYDGEDTLSGGPHEDTPTTTLRNGLDQTLAVERRAAPGAAPLTHRVRYTELGLVEALIDPTGTIQSQTRDLLGRVLQVQHPDGGPSTFAYDDAGNQVTETDARGASIETEYDGLNRVVAVWSEADPAGTLVSRRYDRRGDCPADQCSNVAGQLASIAYVVEGLPAGETFGYTARGNQVFQRQELLGHAYAFATRYDALDRVTSNVLPSGLEVGVTLDGADSVVAVPGYFDTVSYGPTGLPASVAAANGVETVLSYDARLLLSGLSVSGPDGELLVAEGLTRDRADNVIEVRDGRADDGAPQGTARFAYDSLYRLVRAELDPERPAHSETLTYTYDDADRVLTVNSDQGASSPAHVGQLQYGEAAGPHALTRAGDLGYGYDPAGNVTSRGEVAYTWDHLGRLVAARRGSDVIQEVAYGGSRDRLVKREGGHLALYLTAQFEVRDGTAVTYLALGDQRYARIEEPSFQAQALSDLAPAGGDDLALTSEPDGVISAGDAWLAQGFQAGSLAQAAGEPRPDRATVLLNASAERTLHGLDARVTWLHLDHQGNVVAETDESGARVARSEHYPFGATRFASEGADPDGYTGKETDQATGLQYFGARYQDPLTGRWLSPDPAFRVQAGVEEHAISETTCAYAFNANNPTNRRDPDGQRAWWNPASPYRFRNFMAKQLQAGTIRPTIGWMTALGLRPDAKYTKKEAYRIVKSIMAVGKKDGHTGLEYPFKYSSKGDHDATIGEWLNGVKEVHGSKAMQKLAYEKGHVKDLQQFAITGTAIGGAMKDMDAKVAWDYQVLRATSTGPSFDIYRESNPPKMPEPLKMNDEFMTAMTHSEALGDRSVNVSFAPKQGGFLSRLFGKK